LHVDVKMLTLKHDLTGGGTALKCEDRYSPSAFDKGGKKKKGEQTLS